MSTAPAVTAHTAGPPLLEHTSPLQRATRASYRTPQPVWRRVVQVALAQLGRPYVWGAKGPDAFDCSGLTQYAYRQAGIALGPDTYTQIKQGQPVTAAQAGDLVFPAAELTSRGPGHVVLAISTTQAVEAPGRGMMVRLIPLPAGIVRRIA